MFCLELWYFVEKYSSTVDVAIQLQAEGTTCFKKELWKISRLELQDEIFGKKEKL